MARVYFNEAGQIVAERDKTDNIFNDERIKYIENLPERYPIIKKIKDFFVDKRYGMISNGWNAKERNYTFLLPLTLSQFYFHANPEKYCQEFKNVVKDVMPATIQSDTTNKYIDIISFPFYLHLNTDIRAEDILIGNTYIQFPMFSPININQYKKATQIMSEIQTKSNSLDKITQSERMLVKSLLIQKIHEYLRNSKSEFWKTYETTQNVKTKLMKNIGKEALLEIYVIDIVSLCVSAENYVYDLISAEQLYDELKIEDNDSVKRVREILEKTHEDNQEIKTEQIQRMVKELDVLNELYSEAMKEQETLGNITVNGWEIKGTEVKLEDLKKLTE